MFVGCGGSTIRWVVCVALTLAMMAYKKHKQHRLPGYDYAQPGAYFTTICTHEREHTLGEVVDGVMCLSKIGMITQDFLLKTSDTFENSTLDEWVIMPNHVHLILVIHSESDFSSGNSRNAPRRVPTSIQDVIPTGLINNPDYSPLPGIRPLDKNSVSSIINHFKGNVKRWCNKNGYESFRWQSRFHDHIIRNETALLKIRQYIQDNPRRWQEDKFFRS